MAISPRSIRVLARVAALTLSSAAVCAAQQPAADTAKAESVYKNIQVLNGVAADQVTPIMRLIARDLGVTCEYCHDERDRAKDGLAPKDTARRMLTMLRDIGQSFEVTEIDEVLVRQSMRDLRARRTAVRAPVPGGR